MERRAASRLRPPRATKARSATKGGRGDLTPLDFPQKTLGQPVEYLRLLEIHQVPRRRHDRQARGGARTLQEKARLERAGVFVADHDVSRYLQRAELALEARERRPPRLDPALDVRAAQVRMFEEAPA